MEKYPDTVRTLDHCFYVDDLVTGEDDAKSAFDLSSKAAKIMSEAGMNLRKWISNDYASIKAYGAVSYVRLRTFDKISVHLLASKSRVAPLKVLTLPRLELMGALLAARLELDSGPSNRWKVFVANRVKRDTIFNRQDSWRHCPGKDNPSDLLTRGISADSLINCEKWWKGPSFLQEGNTVPNVLSGALFPKSSKSRRPVGGWVKAVKYHLRRVMGNLRFTYEEFLTILNQIEGVLNSRPLYPLSCDPGDFDALTPGHF
ncbi:integrase_H2C2 domain-containing protein [Trichonephila clavipes]|nr:integrase_H2C2 domain-containing protein [Trichonephila clavipes]